MTTPQLLTQAAPAGLAGKTFGIRAVSYIIDVVILNGLQFVAGLIGGALLAGALAILGIKFALRQPTFVENLFFGLALSFSYFLIFEWLYGATPGKLIMGMRIVDERGAPIGLRAAFIRGLLRYVDGILFGAVAYSNMKLPLYQRLGDKSARTVQSDVIQASGGRAKDLAVVCRCGAMVSRV